MTEKFPKHAPLDSPDIKYKTALDQTGQLSTVNGDRMDYVYSLFNKIRKPPREEAYAIIAELSEIFGITGSSTVDSAVEKIKKHIEASSRLNKIRTMGLKIGDLVVRDGTTGKITGFTNNYKIIFKPLDPKQKGVSLNPVNVKKAEV